MREILFRGKRSDNGEWVEGLLWKKKYNTNKIFIRCFLDKDDNEEVFVVHPETIGQYTGCKDCDGVKIFEGDIIGSDRYFHKKYFFNDDGYGEVFWNSGGFRVENDGLSLSFKELSKDVFSVIGNIYDNPELLEKE